MLDVDDRTLTDRCRAGDGAAFTELVDAYWGFLERLAIRSGVSDVDGVVQESFVRLWIVFQRGKGPVLRGRIAAYLRVVLVRSASSMSQHRLLLAPPSEFEAVMSVNTAEVDAELLPTYLLDGLSTLERAVVWMCWIEDRPRQEVADALGLPSANTVSKLLARARNQMRDAWVGATNTQVEADDVEVSRP